MLEDKRDHGRDLSIISILITSAKQEPSEWLLLSKNLEQDGGKQQPGMKVSDYVHLEERPSEWAAVNYT